VNAKKRLFLAVNLSVASTRRIGDTIAKMRSVAQQRGTRVIWVPPANLHVTVKFLGWAEISVLDPIQDRMREIARGRKGFDLVARGVGAFPSETRPRVLWVGLDAQPALLQLAQATEAAIADLGFPKEPRPFSPHVTIGRVKEGHGSGELLAPFLQTEFGTSLVREVVLYESIMKSTGSEYTALSRIPLDVPSYRAERQTREVEEGSQEKEDPDGGQHAT
jgi:RNA 2',3'-cyclic 3'-phosphodiesterase